MMNWTVYRAQAMKSLSPACETALGQSMRAVLFFSARTAATFVQLVKQAKLTSCCEDLIALCLSVQVASAAEALPWQQIAIADTPHEDALVEALQAALEPRPFERKRVAAHS